MYSGWQRGKAPSGEWTEQTTEFLDNAFSLLGVVENETIKCPCAMHRNYFKLKRHTIELHLCKYGFKEGYEIWTEHGESHVSHDDYCPTANMRVSMKFIAQPLIMRVMRLWMALPNMEGEDMDDDIIVMKL